MKNFLNRPRVGGRLDTCGFVPSATKVPGGRPRGATKAIAVLGMAAMLTACKVAVEVPPGGSVVSASGAYSCSAGSTCTISVDDVFFDETFRAVPAEGHFFKKWAKKPGSLCAAKVADCHLATTGFAGIQKLVDILESNRTFYLTPVFEKIPKLMAEDISTEGNKTPGKDGYTLAGTLVINNPGELDHKFEEADLDVRVNDNGEVYSLTGTATLPHALFDNVTTDGKVRAEIGMRTGAEINADEAIEIKLRDERSYLVLLLDESVNINIADPDKPGKSTRQKISTPASGKLIFILDPADPMYYRYGETPLLGAYGEGRSKDGLLPFVPDLSLPGIERFDGHQYRTGKYGVGIKLVDLLELQGELIVRDPDFGELDFSDPFSTLKEYRAGFNGGAKLALSVVGFGLFELDVAQASALFNANPQRGSMTMGTEIEPGNSPLPEWMPIEPGSRITAGLKAGRGGKVVLNMGGRYRSTLPPANIEGSIRVTPDSVTLSGTVVDGITVPIDMTFRDNETRARVGLNIDLTDEIERDVLAEFDRANAEVEDALARLDQAIADYEFELSLRGLRQVLPAITDEVKRELNKVPGLVYDKVKTRVKDEIDKRRCPFGVCLIPKSLRDSIANKAADKGRDRARSEIKPYVALMTELKTLAQGPSDEELLEALESALRLAYSFRTFKRTFSVRVGVPKLFTKTFSHTVDEKILDQAMADRILEAANNLHLIPATSDVVVKGRQIIDQLPAEEVIKRIRRELQSGIRQVPGIREVSYTVRGDDYQAAVIFADDRRFEVDFNVLNPSEAARGIAELVAGQLLAASP